jgi:hypothetical protein
MSQEDIVAGLKKNLAAGVIDKALYDFDSQVVIAGEPVWQGDWQGGGAPPMPDLSKLDLYARADIAAIGANPDIDPQLKSRYDWMLAAGQRDPYGKGWADEIAGRDAIVSQLQTQYTQSLATWLANGTITAEDYANYIGHVTNMDVQNIPQQYLTPAVAGGGQNNVTTVALEDINAPHETDPFAPFFPPPPAPPAGASFADICVLAAAAGLWYWYRYY